MINCKKCRAALPDDANFCMKCGAKQSNSTKTKSRGNGQGTAIKRGNSWTAVTTEGFYILDGKLHQRRHWKGGFKSKTAALAFAANPVPDKPPSPTLSYYWEGWKNSDMQDLSKSKQGAFTIAWRKLQPLASKPIEDLTIADLQNCVDKAAPTHYTARDIRVLLSHLYKRAVAEGNARTNLAQFIHLPPLEEKEMEAFSEQEIHQLWEAYGAGDRFVGFVLLMIYSGMMPGELLDCKEDMIDWDKREIRGCGKKTKKRKITPIVFPELIEPVLQDLIANSNSRMGNIVGMNKDRFYAEYHAALARAGVRDLPPYSCRHTTATALALGNIAPSVIQEVMRHTKFATTQRYIHPDTASTHAAVNTMGKGQKASER